MICMTPASYVWHVICMTQVSPPTATHCNTLQHVICGTYDMHDTCVIGVTCDMYDTSIAPYCNTLQHAATRHMYDTSVAACDIDMCMYDPCVMCGTWDLYDPVVCMTQSYVWHSSMYDTVLCMTQSYVWHSFMWCMTVVCMTHSVVCMTQWYVGNVIRMPQFHVWHSSM